MSRRIVIAGVASGFACVAPLSAVAQAAAAAVSPSAAASTAATPNPQAGAKPVSPADTSAETTIVYITAQKRKEDIRDVPLSVSVLSAEQLQNSQISTVEDITRHIPNVSFTTQAGPGLGTVEIRGVSSQAGQATTSVYLDDVSLTTRNLYSQGTAEPRFFDIANVEVLRGPQGTLYGGSSLGGTIKFISNQPDPKRFSANATVTVSDTQHGGVNYEAQGVVNVPLVKDSIALRIGVDKGHDSGYIDQVDPTTLKVIDKGINSADWDVVKLALKADMGHGWSITPALFAQQTDTADIDATYTTVGNYQPNAGVPLGKYETSKIVREPGRDRLSIPSVTIAGDTGLGSFTGVLSGYARRFNRISDGTNLNSAYLATQITDPALATVVGGLPSDVMLSNKIDQTSLEMRFASKDYDPKGSSPFTWIVGTYVSDATTQVVESDPIYGLGTAFAAAGQSLQDPDELAGGFPDDFAGDNSYYSARHYHDRQASVFGESTWHLTPALAATVGLRYLLASQIFTREGNYYFNNGPTCVGPAAAGCATPPIVTHNTATTPRLAVNWQVTPDTSLYGNIAKGFRLGGANRPVPDTPDVEANLRALGIQGPPPATFAPDSLWSYEVGSKSDLWDHRLSVNVAAYFLDWKNIQQDINLASAGFDFESNAGNAKNYGLEAELRGRVTDSLTLTGSAGLTHATFSQDVPQFGTDSPGGLDSLRKGDPVPGVPKANASLGFDYHWAVSDAMGAFVRGDEQWTGSSHGSIYRSDPDYRRPSYFEADASAGVNFDRWEFTAFIKNATNNYTALQHPNIQSVNDAYYLRPRTIGVTGNYEF